MCLREHKPYPERIQNAPRLRFYLTPIWEAFWHLSTCHPVGFGALGPIPWTAVDRYADHLELDDPDDREDLYYLIRKMDEVFLEHANKKSDG